VFELDCLTGMAWCGHRLVETFGGQNTGPTNSVTTKPHYACVAITKPCQGKWKTLKRKTKYGNGTTEKEIRKWEEKPPIGSRMCLVGKGW